jgi:Ca-activated chloride channel homolog
MSSSRRSPWPLLAAALVGFALIAGARDYAGRKSAATVSRADIGAVASADPSCRVITVVASSEKAALLQRIAGEYNGARHTVDGSCAQATVVSKASGDAEAALARGWDAHLDGPRPDVWTPAASAWAVLLQQQLIRLDKPSPVPASTPSIAQTPLVIAMPRPMAQALGWPSKPLGWSDLFRLATDPRGWGSVGHPEWGRFTLGKTNPHLSTSGLNATIASFFAATGLSSDLSVARVRSPRAQQFVRQIESSVVHYGDTTLTFLSNMAKADAAGKGLSYVSAVTVEEKSVWDYNQGNPSGDPSTLGVAAKPHDPLVAIYPKDGTLVSDSPYVVLSEPWVDKTRRAVAADFLAYVRSPVGQSAFQSAAFRTYDGRAGDPITPDNGLLPAGPPVLLSPPTPPVLQAISDSWDNLRKRARVLVVIDVSGSMGTTVGESGKTKLDLARDAATVAIRRFAPDDLVGLWIFSSNFGAHPYRQLVPIGPASRTVPAMVSEIGRLEPTDGTALYATIRAAGASMLRDFDRGKINAIVVLTDGQNEYPADSDLDSLVGQLHGENLDTSVRVFTVGYGADADVAALTAIAEASSAAYYNAADPTSISKVLTSVLSNF